MTTTWFVYPSEKAAERKRREIFAASKESVRLGETVFSLSHFLKTVTAPEKPLLTRSLQKHFIFFSLRHHPLRYFEKLKRSPGLANAFMNAIRQLKRHNIMPEQLEALLKEAGSLREYDLLKTYERYEALKKEKDVLDEEDLYRLPVPNLPFENLVFEDFLERVPALDSFLAPFKTRFITPAVPKPEVLKQAELCSLPSPHQETDWFLIRLQNWMEEGVPVDQIGIVTAGPAGNYDRIWKKTGAMGIAEGESPFLTWRERPEGREALRLALQTKTEEASLTEWIGAFLEKIGNREIINTLEPLCFFNHALDIGTLTRREWLEWLQEHLDRPPQTRIKESLAGLQWIGLEEGETTLLQYLWAPQMLEGVFPRLRVSPFFQEKRDRSRKEWKILCEAFPEPRDLFEKKRGIFLRQIACAQKALLTCPRRNSFGEEVSPSPFTWDFGENVVKEVAPLFFGTMEDLTRKRAIEEERRENRPVTGAFHADFRNSPLPEKLGPQKPGHIFSPSRLETYAQCPFKYFANRVLGIPQEKDFSPQVDPDDRGTLFHDSLEKFLREHGGLFLEARKNPEKETELFEMLKKTVAEIFREGLAQMNYANGELYRHLRQKTEEQAVLLIRNELAEARSIEAPLIPSHFEWSFGTAPENSLDAGGVLLGGRVDRIDCDPVSMRFLVLDYKTGSSAAAKFRDKLLQGLSLQLPVYILAVQKLLLPGYEPAGGMLVEAKSGEKTQGLLDSRFNETHFRMGKRSRALLETKTLEETITATVAAIQKYVAQIREGYFSAQPKDCRASCDYKDICRYPYKPFE